MEFHLNDANCTFNSDKNDVGVGFKLYSTIDGLGIYFEITLKLLLLDRNNDKATYIQSIAWCRQATAYLCELMLTQMHTYITYNNIEYKPKKIIWELQGKPSTHLYANERFVPICVTFLRNVNCSFHPFFINNRYTNTWAVRKSTCKKRW